mgnify:CR=1 FL=1
MSDYNKKPIVLTEGKVFIDGEEIFDCVSARLNLHRRHIQERY